MRCRGITCIENYVGSEREKNDKIYQYMFVSISVMWASSQHPSSRIVTQ